MTSNALSLPATLTTPLDPRVFIREVDVAWGARPQGALAADPRAWMRWGLTLSSPVRAGLLLTSELRAQDLKDAEAVFGGQAAWRLTAFLGRSSPVLDGLLVRAALERDIASSHIIDLWIRDTDRGLTNMETCVIPGGFERSQPAAITPDFWHAIMSTQVAHWLTLVHSTVRQTPASWPTSDTHPDIASHWEALTGRWLAQYQKMEGWDMPVIPRIPMRPPRVSGPRAPITPDAAFPKGLDCFSAAWGPDLADILECTPKYNNYNLGVGSSAQMSDTICLLLRTPSWGDAAESQILATGAWNTYSMEGMAVVRGTYEQGLAALSSLLKASLPMNAFWISQLPSFIERHQSQIDDEASLLFLRVIHASVGEMTQDSEKYQSLTALLRCGVAHAAIVGRYREDASDPSSRASWSVVRRLIIQTPAVHLSETVLKSWLLDGDREVRLGVIQRLGRSVGDSSPRSLVSAPLTRIR